MKHFDIINFKAVIQRLIFFLAVILFNTALYAQVNSLHFDGTNDYVDCGNGASVQLTGMALTLEAWVYPTSFKTNIWEGNIINKNGIID